MRRIAALSTLLLLTGLSATALADEPPERPKTEEKEAPKEPEKAAEKKDAPEEKKGGCTVADEDDAMLGLAALVLLGSAAALRRRPA